MLKKILIGLAVLVVLLIIAFIALAVKSRKGTAPGLVDGQLAACPSSPNCVSSEAGTPEGKQVAPLVYEGPQSWLTAKEAIESLGGTITEDTGRYLSAEFKTPTMGFVDDVELRLDEAAGVIHIRSASRVGYSDRGVNKKRVAAIRAAAQS